MCPWFRLAPLAMLLLGACVVTVPTSSKNYSIESAAVAPLRAGQTVALANAYSAESNAILPLRYGNKLSIEQKQLTDTAIAMLASALEKRGIRTAEGGDKSVTLRVRAVGYRMQVMRWTGRVILEATLGDGTVISSPNESLSPKGWENAFDGAVLFALNDLLADERFVAYMNR